MEILIYYLIACVSFSIMFIIRYGYEIVETTLDVLDMFDIDYVQDGDWTPWAYYTALFIINIIYMPKIWWIIISTPRYAVIKECTSEILIQHFDFKKEK